MFSKDFSFQKYETLLRKFSSKTRKRLARVGAVFEGMVVSRELRDEMLCPLNKKKRKKASSIFEGNIELTFPFKVSSKKRQLIDSKIIKAESQLW